MQEIEKLRSSIRAVVTEILEIITARYVSSGRVVPAEILQIKDETMDLYLKSNSEADIAVLEQYEIKAKVIRERLVKGM